MPCCPAGGLSSWCEGKRELDAFTRGEIDLRLLGLKQVDLMLLHWPCATPEETLRTYRALEDFQLAGKARAKPYPYSYPNSYSYS